MGDKNSSKGKDKTEKISHGEPNGISDMKVSSKEEKTEKISFWQRFRKKKQVKKPTEAVSLPSLFRYASCVELFGILLATIASMAFGVSLPVSLVVFGDTVDSFTSRAADLCSLNFTSLAEQYCPPHVTLTSINFYTTIRSCNFTGTNFTNINYDLSDRTRKQIITLIIIGCVSLISGYVRVAVLDITSERLARTIRQILFQSILKKDVVFFDTHKTGELSLRLTDDVNKIRNGIGDKLGSAIEMVTTFISCVIIGFVKGWKLAFVILSLSPVIVVAISILFKIVTKVTITELRAYGKAGAVAEEVICSIRTVLSYNGQEKEMQRYEQYLDDARKCGVKKGVTSGITSGITMFLVYCIYALGFWYGTKLVWDEDYTIGNIFTVFMTINFGVFCLGQASPYFQALYEARVAAFIVWQVISEPSKINNDSEKDFTKEDLIGDIQFSNVCFSYPSRPDVSILNNLSFDIQHGQTIALVGSSGSGKSTCVQLLQRFYDTQSGSILIDGKQVNEYNLKWLRKQIGVVSQEPVLFHTTIRQNILFGHASATDEEIHEAAKKANAHDFIMALPDKYETEVGERGAALSGGQKQRIAIARALLRDPKILLLDEATSALDNESEEIVQEALDRAAQGRTTLIIAHRLSTIRNADKIIVMQKGEVVEEGDHGSLMRAKSTYFGLVEQQILRQAEEEEELELKRQETTRALSSVQEDQHLIEKQIRRSIADGSTNLAVPDLYGKKNSKVDVELNENETVTIKEKRPMITSSILRMNKPEWILIVIGCLAAFLNGVEQPVYCFVQTKLTIVFQECDRNDQKRQVLMYVLVYLGIGVFSLIFLSLQGFVFAHSGEALTKRLRSKAFRAILRQDISYFDQAKHSTGALCTSLATEASAVQGASGIRFGLIFQNIVSMIIGIIVGFAYCWQLTLVVLAFVPLILFGSIAKIRLVARFARKDKEIFENAGKVALESIQNVRTVLQLTKEDYFYNEYSEILNTIYRSAFVRSHISGALFSITSSAYYFAVAAFISLGTSLVQDGTVPFENAFMVLNSVIFTARTIGRALTLLPDYGKAIEAAENIFELLNRKPAIDNESKDGDEIPDFTGELAFDSLYFAYPTRPESIILANFKLNIKPGQKVALVGTSGCGKSTTIQLIERFYDANFGRLLVDSKDIRSLNLQWYRSQIGIVSQEPVLFNMSIRENIAYGDNNRKDIPLEEIIEAAKSANIHDFIQLPPQGYETNCGAKGTQLSGGQKQRIAIARALLRNPKILLLDEATSALDSESEKIVQEALDRAQENRTSITIAHRLSTIQNADMICVVHNGIVVESGTHEELLELGGRYYRLAHGKLK